MTIHIHITPYRYAMACLGLSLGTPKGARISITAPSGAGQGSITLPAGAAGAGQGSATVPPDYTETTETPTLTC